MFLITTADTRFWETNRKLLFLGEWCKRFDLRRIWATLEYETLPYHWDDRERLYRDYLYLRDVYEQYLGRLAGKLDRYHGQNHSIRYWRIIIGPWLRWFTESLYDRYLSICEARDFEKIASSSINSASPYLWTPAHFGDFVRQLIGDEYNQVLYSYLIKRLGGIPFSEKPVSPEFTAIKNRSLTVRSAAKSAILRLLGVYNASIPNRLRRIVFMRSGLHRWDLVRLDLMLKQWPSMEFPAAASEKGRPEPLRRQELQLSGTNEFESILGDLIPIHMPLAYLEGYDEVRRSAMASFPQKPRFIFTTPSGSMFDDAVKIWLAENAEKGALLAVGQHGGHYGTGRWSSSEEHEIDISDRYFSWGWKSKKNKGKVIPLPAERLTYVRKKCRYNKKGPILWVAMSMPRYSYWMYSLPVGPQMLSYLDEQHRFAQSLSDEVRRLLLLRLYPEDYGWCEAERWREMDPSIRISNCRESILSQLGDSRLCIATYNATTFLETFAADFPTIMFWNPKHWDLRAEAQPYYDLLRKAGIWHATPESAAALAMEIWENPLNWWRSREVQDAKDAFCGEFALASDHWQNRWCEEIRRLSAFCDRSNTVDATHILQ